MASVINIPRSSCGKWNLVYFSDTRFSTYQTSRRFIAQGKLKRAIQLVHRPLNFICLAIARPIWSNHSISRVISMSLFFFFLLSLFLRIKPRVHVADPPGRLFLRILAIIDITRTLAKPECSSVEFFDQARMKPLFPRSREIIEQTLSNPLDAVLLFFPSLSAG